MPTDSRVDSWVPITTLQQADISAWQNAAGDPVKLTGEVLMKNIALSFPVKAFAGVLDGTNGLPTLTVDYNLVPTVTQTGVGEYTLNLSTLTFQGSLLLDRIQAFITFIPSVGGPTKIAKYVASNPSTGEFVIQVSEYQVQGNSIFEIPVDLENTETIGFSAMVFDYGL